MRILLSLHAIGPGEPRQHTVRSAALAPVLFFTAFNAFCGTSYDSPSPGNTASTTIADSQASPSTAAYMNAPSGRFDYQAAMADAERARQAVLQKGWQTSPRSNSPEDLKAWREENHRVIVDAEHARQSVLKAGEDRIRLARIQEEHEQERHPASGSLRMEEHPAAPIPRSAPDQAPQRPMAPTHAKEAGISDDKPLAWLRLGLILLLIAAIGGWLYRQFRTPSQAVHARPNPVKPAATSATPPVSQAAAASSPRTGSVPGWATFTAAADYEHFMKEVRAYFRKRNIAITLNDDRVQPVGGNHILGLRNLAQLCRQADRSEWSGIVAKQFDLLLANAAKAADRTQPAPEFSDIADRLRIRLYREDQIGAHAAQLVCRRDMEGVLTVLVEDRPETMQTISRGDAAAWGKSDDELFAIAERHLRNADFTLQEAKFDDKLSILFARDDCNYTSSRALILDLLKDCVGTYGSLVTVPNRHCLFVVPVEVPQAIQLVGKVMGGTLDLFKEGPGSISPHLYWYYEGEFTRVSYPEADGTVGLKLPHVFNRMMEAQKGTAGRPAGARLH